MTNWGAVIIDNVGDSRDDESDDLIESLMQQLNCAQIYTLHDLNWLWWINDEGQDLNSLEMW